MSKMSFKKLSFSLYRINASYYCPKAMTSVLLHPCLKGQSLPQDSKLEVLPVTSTPGCSIKLLAEETGSLQPCIVDICFNSNETGQYTSQRPCLSSASTTAKRGSTWAELLCTKSREKPKIDQI